MASDERELPIPRYDFYQTSSHLIVAVYLKGYGAESVKNEVEVTFAAGQVREADLQAVIILPNLEEATGPKGRVTLSPLYAEANPAGSSHRILSTKIELKLAKTEPINWPSLLSSGETRPSDQASSSTITPSQPTPVEKPRAQRKNWDKFEVEEDKPDSADPNAGGEAALQKLFSQIYGNADDETKRAMIKSYTESGGTTLSTDWSKIGQEKTAIQPPEGMEAKKY